MSRDPSKNKDNKNIKATIDCILQTKKLSQFCIHVLITVLSSKGKVQHCFW